MFAGGYNFAPYGKIKYELGYLFGVTPATPRGAIRWNFEYEIPFQAASERPLRRAVGE